ncbi:MAG: hypothetical protein ACYTGX_09500 [Planctomycetota bacterium]|jgi:hypothetical protein
MSRRSALLLLLPCAAAVVGGVIWIGPGGRSHSIQAPDPREAFVARYDAARARFDRAYDALSHEARVQTHPARSGDRTPEAAEEWVARNRIVHNATAQAIHFQLHGSGFADYDDATRMGFLLRCLSGAAPALRAGIETWRAAGPLTQAEQAAWGATDGNLQELAESCELLERLLRERISELKRANGLDR